MDANILPIQKILSLGAYLHGPLESLEVFVAISEDRIVLFYCLAGCYAHLVSLFGIFY
jgi:hypothetical protein